MIPRRVPNPRTDAVTRATICQLADRMGVSPELLDRLTHAQAQLPFELHIFSAARSRDHQARVSSTPFDRSTHADEDTRGCPRLATGVDVQPVQAGIRQSGAAVAQMGAAFVHAGLRWGGGAPVGADGIPVDNERWHVDLGPRAPP